MVELLFGGPVDLEWLVVVLLMTGAGLSAALYSVQWKAALLEDRLETIELYLGADMKRAQLEEDERNGVIRIY